MTDVLTRLKRVNVISKVRSPKGTDLSKADLSDIDDDIADVVEIDPIFYYSKNYQIVLHH